MTSQLPRYRSIGFRYDGDGHLMLDLSDIIGQDHQDVTALTIQFRSDRPCDSSSSSSSNDNDDVEHLVAEDFPALEEADLSDDDDDGEGEPWEFSWSDSDTLVDDPVVARRSSISGYRLGPLRVINHASDDELDCGGVDDEDDDDDNNNNDNDTYGNDDEAKAGRKEDEDIDGRAMASDWAAAPNVVGEGALGRPPAAVAGPSNFFPRNRPHFN